MHSSSVNEFIVRKPGTEREGRLRVLELDGKSISGADDSGGQRICKWHWEFRRRHILPLEPVESAS